MTPDDIQAVQQLIGYQFTHPELLLQAFTHPSAVEDHPDRAILSNQRLEFLGDAVLGLIVAETVYRQYAAHPEGALTQLKTHYVRKASLAAVSAQIQLGQFLTLGRGEALTGGSHRRSNLADLFEALVGAIYLDGGLSAAQAFVTRNLLERIPRSIDDFEADAKSALQELTQAHFKELPKYDVVSTAGPAHAPTFTVQVRIGDRVLAQGAGRSKKYAGLDAAKHALAKLRQEGIEPPS